MMPLGRPAEMPPHWASTSSSAATFEPDGFSVLVKARAGPSPNPPNRCPRDWNSLRGFAFVFSESLQLRGDGPKHMAADDCSGPFDGVSRAFGAFGVTGFNISLQG